MSINTAPLTLIFSTHNAHKLEEVKKIIAPGIDLLSLTDISVHDEIEENGHSFEENSLIKSSFIYSKTGKNCFADDSGLVIDALDGAPGIYSARYSGSRDMQVNLDLVLHNMQGKENRAARFVCVISLYLDGIPHVFTGAIEGSITLVSSGSGGFGYDPIFQPAGYDYSFAEMSVELKNEISHRAIAMKKLNAFLLNR